MYCRNSCHTTCSQHSMVAELPLLYRALLCLPTGLSCALIRGSWCYPRVNLNFIQGVVISSKKKPAKEVTATLTATQLASCRSAPLVLSLSNSPTSGGAAISATMSLFLFTLIVLTKTTFTYRTTRLTTSLAFSKLLDTGASLVKLSMRFICSA